MRADSRPRKRYSELSLLSAFRPLAITGYSAVYSVFKVHRCSVLSFSRPLYVSQGNLLGSVSVLLTLWILPHVFPFVKCFFQKTLKNFFGLSALRLKRLCCVQLSIIIHTLHGMSTTFFLKYFPLGVSN